MRAGVTSEEGLEESCPVLKQNSQTRTSHTGPGPINILQRKSYATLTF